MHPAHRELASTTTARHTLLFVASALAFGSTLVLSGPLGVAILAVAKALGWTAASRLIGFGVLLARFVPAGLTLAFVVKRLAKSFDAASAWWRLARIGRREEAQVGARLLKQKELRENPEWDLDRRERIQANLDAVVESIAFDAKEREDCLTRLKRLADEDLGLWKKGI